NQIQNVNTVSNFQGSLPGPSSSPPAFPVRREKENTPSAANEASPFPLVAMLEAENYFLKKELQEALDSAKKLSSSFSFRHIEGSDEKIVLHTGLPCRDVFMCLYELMDSFQLNYFYGWAVVNMPKIDQLLLTLMKLRLNLVNDDLAIRFNISSKTVANIFYTWLYALHEIIFKNIMKEIPSRNKNKLCMPTCFNNFTNCRIILDCTEIYCHQPKNMEKQKATYSSYKHRNTLKGLIGVAPNGVVTYASKLYPGSVSDKKIVKHCGILEQMVPGDLIIADKGFLISDLLPPGVSLNIPPFLTTAQFTPQQVIQTRTIAKARIHVERAIRRIKCYKILSLVPASLVKHSSYVFQVCAALTNFQYPLIREVEDLYRNEDE
uniref:Uncharacterized protein LOC114340901 n=1 Tax=Diabrotica virgifera virgifera TaxID=50390 RepID=A0A6P7GDE3_DIAVI